MVEKKFLEIKNPMVLNPFLWFSIIWIVVFFLYNLNFSTLYGKVNPTLIFFFVLAITISFVISLFFNKKLKRFKTVVINPSFSIKPALLIVCLFAIEFIYCGYIPLFTSGSGSYASFGIPFLHVVFVTLNSYYIIVLFLRYFCYKRKITLFSIFLCLLQFILIFSRGMLIFLFLIILLLFICSHRVKLRHYICSFLLIAIVLYIFGGLGNIRSGYSWNDSSFILSISHIEKFPLPKQFSWAYMYIISPLGNLNHVFNNYEPINSLSGLFYHLIPDFISKRIIDYSDPILITPQSLFTVKTAFCSIYYAYGLMGVLLLCIDMIVIVFCTIYLTRKREARLIVLVYLCALMMITFFENSFMYSGYSFALIYPIVFQKNFRL